MFGLRGLALARDLELRKVALPGSGPIERALTAVVVERFLTLQVLSRHWHGTLRLAGVVVGYNGSSEAGWPEPLRALGEALGATLGARSTRGTAHGPVTIAT